MLQLSVKRLVIYITFFFYLAGCAIDEGDSGSSSSGFDAERTGNGTALVSWASPTDNTDNSTLTDLAGFKIYYGTFPGEYDQTITINNPGLSSYLVENLASADWFFVMTAFNTSGIESAYSAEVTKEIVEID
jgi:hypothetical protein